MDTIKPTGRFAPSPSGRMHLGNIYTALLSWLSMKVQGGRWILRIEDLDPQRSKIEYAHLIEEDLHWLGLEWDEGGLDNLGSHGPYVQSQRHEIYKHSLDRLKATGYTYPCTCTRAELRATQAPHMSDGHFIYPGTCRPSVMPRHQTSDPTRPHATRIYVPDQEINFTDLIYGPQAVNLAHQCGDFVLRRADGAWAYQLAVVVDDALMGVTEVMRGADLLQSSAQQIYLYNLLGYEPPRFAHLPLLCNDNGQRLSKRDASLAMDQLRQNYSAPALIGMVASRAGLIEKAEPLTATELAHHLQGTPFYGKILQR